MVEKWVKTNCLEHGVSTKVVDNVKNYLNMQYKKKRRLADERMPKKLIFIKIWGRVPITFETRNLKLEIFRGNGLPSGERVPEIFV